MKNKLIFISPKNTSGGAERVMVTIANQFSKKLYDVIFVTFDSSSNFYPVDKNVKIERLNVGTEQYSKVLKYFLLPYIEIKRYFKLKKLISKEKPNCVISFLFTSNILSTIACRKLNVPIILSERNDPFRYGKIKRFIMRIFYSKANGFVCQSSKMKDYAEKNYSLNNVVYIPNPLNEGQISTESVKKQDKIITVGRLIDQKNQRLLIDAFSEIHDEFSTFQLYIYGDGEKRKELEQQIKDLKLESFVFLPGVEKEVLSHNRDAKLFVLSSDWEGYPNVLIEAMANGICSISSDFATGSARDIIKNGVNGYLFQVGDKEELVEIMKRLLRDERKMSTVAEEGRKIYNKLEIKNIIEEWLDYIEMIMKNGG